MSSPQLTDANTSSEWFRTVAEPGAEKPRTPSQVSISAAGRRKRFGRLVAYTMGGLVAFTLLGIASFAWRQHSMQSALAAPVPLAPVAEPAVTPAVAPAPAATVALAAAAAAPASKAAPRTAPAAKAAKKATRSPFLGAKPSSKGTASTVRKP